MQLYQRNDIADMEVRITELTNQLVHTHNQTQMMNYIQTIRHLQAQIAFINGQTVGYSKGMHASLAYQN